MTARMPEFAMPSDDELARERARVEDEAREAAAREAAARTRTVEESLVAAAPGADDGSTHAAHVARPLRVRARARTAIVAFVAGAALVAAAFAIVPAVERQAEAGSMADLARVVEDYVGAIEAGHLDAATRMAPVDADYADDALLVEAEPSMPPGIACEEPIVGGDRATVSCSVAVASLGGGGSPIRMQLVRDGGWRIETGLAVASPLLVQLAQVDAIGGVAVPAGIDPLADPLWLYPGSYELDATTSPRLVLSVADLHVIGDGFLWTGGVQPGVEMRNELVAAAADYVAACAATSAAGCPDVTPLGPGERFATLSDGYVSYLGSELVLGVLVRRAGGVPDQWSIDVRASFADDLESYVVVASVPRF